MHLKSKSLLSFPRVCIWRHLTSAERFLWRSMQSLNFHSKSVYLFPIRHQVTTFFVNISVFSVVFTSIFEMPLSECYYLSSSKIWVYFQSFSFFQAYGNVIKRVCRLNNDWIFIISHFIYFCIFINFPQPVCNEIHVIPGTICELYILEFSLQNPILHIYKSTSLLCFKYCHSIWSGVSTMVIFLA